MSLVRPVVINNGMQMPAGQGDVVAKNTATASNATAGAGTLTAAQIATGCILRTGASIAATDTTDTAANIIAAMPEFQIGDTLELLYSNQTAVVMTLAGGTGVTASGTLATAAATCKTCRLTRTGAAAFSLVAL